MIKNGTRVKTPEGEGTVKSSIAGYTGVIYVVELDTGRRLHLNEKDVREAE